MTDLYYARAKEWARHREIECDDEALHKWAAFGERQAQLAREECARIVIAWVATYSFDFWLHQFTKEGSSAIDF